jgi:transcriptional regulator with XRE-family HTH domain
MKKKEEGFNYDYFLGRTLADERGRLDWTQKALSAKMKISPSTLSRMETGEKKIKENVLFQICGVLGLTVTAVTGEAYERYQAHLQAIAPAPDERAGQLLPDHPFASQVVEIYDRYVQSRQEKEKELFLSLLRYIEMLKTAP